MFTNSWAILIGVVAAASPVIIHWLTRPRPVRVPVSTLKFIRGAVEQRRVRYRLRDVLVLLLRTAAVLLLASAVARPLLLHQRTVSDQEDARLVRLVLLDCSQSMAARQGGITKFSRARPIVSQQLRYRAGMKSSLLLAAAEPSAVFDEPTSNLGALRDALESASVRSERLRVQQAINHAAEMLSQVSSESRMELVIVSDFQRANWATVDFSVLPQTCEVLLKSVSSDKDPDNLAVLDFRATRRSEAGQDTEVAIEVGNYSDAARHVRLEVRLGKVVVPFEGYCGARSRTSLGGRFPVAGEGWHTGEVRLTDADDGLPADDRLPISLQVFPRPRLTVLTRDRADDKGSSAWYMQKALRSAVGITDDESLQMVDAADPDPELLRLADVIIAARPGRLSRTAITVLTAMLQRGRSLLYVAGDQLDAANLSDLTASLGSSVRLPVEFLPRPPGRRGTVRHLVEVNRRQSPFSVFGDELSAAVGSLEFSGGLITRGTQAGLKDDVRASLDDQSALLVVSSTGRGRLAIINADLERSSLARTPVLVPLLGELITQDLATQGDAQSSVESGESFTLQLPVGEEHLDTLSVSGPEGEVSDQHAGTLAASPGGIVWDVLHSGPAGVYSVEQSGETVAAVVASIPDEESDLRSLSAEVFEGRLSGGRSLQYAEGTAAAAQEQDTLWVWLAAACVGCVLLELLTLKAFRT